MLVVKNDSLEEKQKLAINKPQKLGNFFITIEKKLTWRFIKCKVLEPWIDS